MVIRFELTNAGLAVHRCLVRCYQRYSHSILPEGVTGSAAFGQLYCTYKVNTMTDERLTTRTLRGYARHRKCAPSAVDRAIVSGRLHRSVSRDGDQWLIDFQLADREWEANTRPRIDRFYYPAI